MPDLAPRVPLCFVAMPFGAKEVPGFTSLVDFDVVYDQILGPAIRTAGMEPIRADEEQSGGFIHKAMFERLLFCPYVVADLTGANPNIFYEVGIRHAVRPFSTLLVFAKGTRLPFDVAPMRASPYELSTDGTPANANQAAELITERLRAAKTDVDTKLKLDSPLYELVDGMPAPDISRLKTDVFRDQVAYERSVKDRLAEARRNGIEAVRQVRAQVEPIIDQEAGVVIDLLLSLRAVRAWTDMITLIDDMSAELQGTVLVREQRGFALNRAGWSEAAEECLTTLIAERGPSSETLGILGRVYKDRWERTKSPTERAAYLEEAIETYYAGFLADPRDAYPGINALTLMEVAGDSRREDLIPVVEFAVKRRLTQAADYWDYATLVELAVLRGDYSGARRMVGKALIKVREHWWEPETTARNLQLIADARGARGGDVTELEGIIEQLRKKAAEASKS